MVICFSSFSYFFFVLLETVNGIPTSNIFLLFLYGKDFLHNRKIRYRSVVPDDDSVLFCFVLLCFVLYFSSGQSSPSLSMGYSSFIKAFTHFQSQSVMDGRDILKPESMYDIMALWVFLKICCFLECCSKESRCIFAFLKVLVILFFFLLLFLLSSLLGFLLPRF